MSKQHILYPKTTYSQRKLLFEIWEETGDVADACRRARVSQGTYYYWRERFKKDGYEGLQKTQKTGPKKGVLTGEGIKADVVRLKEENEGWGKRRIADELAKNNGWVPVISANTVREILREKGMWPEIVSASKKKRES
jgi:transposase